MLIWRHNLTQIELRDKFIPLQACKRMAANYNGRHEWLQIHLLASILGWKRGESSPEIFKEQGTSKYWDKNFLSTKVAKSNDVVLSHQKTSHKIWFDTHWNPYMEIPISMSNIGCKPAFQWLMMAAKK